MTFNALARPTLAQGGFLENVLNAVSQNISARAIPIFKSIEENRSQYLDVHCFLIKCQK